MHRLRLQDGPINLVIGIEGEAPRAAAAARGAFQGLLAGLAAELPLLRVPLGEEAPALRHPVARRMAAACWPYRAGFITPMAAVAGAVAEHVLAAIAAVPGVRRAFVNNGGDIALHLAPGTALNVGVVRDLAHARPEDAALIQAGDPVRGIATSGWPGRSFSRGIADAVTVLAGHAADADAAATVIGNAVDADHPAIRRASASALDPDSDLGDILVTTGVGLLPPATVAAALARGVAVAEALRGRGLIVAALLAIGDVRQTVGAAPALR